MGPNLPPPCPATQVQRVLDLGCGTGRHLVYLAEQGFETFGLDISYSGLQQTNQWLKTDDLYGSLTLADMRISLPFRDNSMDAVLSTQVIHHAYLQTVQETALEINRIVRPGGLILISVPAWRTLDVRMREPSREVEPRTYIPSSGSEKGLPHHLFHQDELPGIFPDFRVRDLWTIDEKIIVLKAKKKQ
jgi:SAM-dependent methyltransferase